MKESLIYIWKYLLKVMSKKTFRIVKVWSPFNPTFIRYRVDRRHTILFFFHWYDTGADLLMPEYYFPNPDKAVQRIADEFPNSSVYLEIEIDHKDEIPSS